ncbi:MAG: hypothetical protein EBR88_02650, partial [Betaproteobacteria bacterium]|nr:hypothetical protein [Betaproteobacteria bacterium]
MQSLKGGPRVIGLTQQGARAIRSKALPDLPGLGIKVDDIALAKGLPIETTKKSPYSIDQNVWGR